MVFCACSLHWECLPMCQPVPPPLPASWTCPRNTTHETGTHTQATAKGSAAPVWASPQEKGGVRRSPSIAQQIPSHQISTLSRSTSNELRREHPSRVAPELDYAPGNLQTSHLSCHVTMDNTKFHKAQVFVNVKAQVVFPAEAAQLQKDPVEIRTRPTSLPSITHLKDHLLALEHRQEFLSRTLALHLCKWLAMNKIFLNLPPCLCLLVSLQHRSPGNTSLFPVTHIHHPAALQRATTKGILAAGLCIHCLKRSVLLLTLPQWHQPATEKQGDSSEQQSSKPQLQSPPVLICHGSAVKKSQINEVRLLGHQRNHWITLNKSNRLCTDLCCTERSARQIKDSRCILSLESWTCLGRPHMIFK